MTADAAFQKLVRSKFRSRFRLSDVDRRYIAEKGMDTIRRHAEDFIRTRLASANPANDGRQTPMRGHPVFKAQHATATCFAPHDTAFLSVAAHDCPMPSAPTD